MNINESADAVIARLMLVYQVDKDVTLAKKIGVSKVTISTWRQRNSVPYANCIQAANDFNVRLDWLLLGKGEMCERDQVKEDIPPYALRLMADVAEMKQEVDRLKQVKEADTPLKNIPIPQKTTYHAPA